MSVLINFHLPKTGGTTMARKLREAYGNHHVDLYYPPPMEFLDERHYPDLRFHWGSVARSISSHNIPYRSPEEFWPGARFAVILREPLEQMISAFHHVSRGAQHMQFMKQVPEEWRDLMSFIRSSEGEKFRIPRFLAGVYAKVTPRLLDRAIANLSKYEIVGLTERYIDTLRLFARIAPEISLEDIRHNDNEEQARDRQYRANLSDDLAKAIEEELELDYILYREGIRIFEAQLAATRLIEKP